MPRLPHYRVDHVQTGNLVLRLALLDELLDGVHDVLVELDGFDCAARDGPHLGFRDRRTVFVQRRQLKREDILD